MRLGRPPATIAEQVRDARDLLTRPDNTVFSIVRPLGVSRAAIYKYIPEFASGIGPAAQAASGKLLKHGAIQR